MKYSISTLALLMAALLILPACRSSRGCCCPPPCGDAEVIEVIEVIEDVPSAGIVGTWEADMELLQQSVAKSVEEQMKAMGEPHASSAKEMFAKFVDAVAEGSVTVTFNEDGTWEANLNLPEPTESGFKQWTESGTWTLDGDKLTMQTTMREGKAVSDDPGTGTLDGDTLRVRGPDAPFEMVLRRRS